MSKRQTVNYLAFAALMVTTILGFQALWGALFLYWVLPNLATGRTFLVSTVTRAEEPVLFWCIQAAWVALGLLLIASDFLPGWA
ncbi:MAG: hypothetical protein AAGD01_03765 [Acidobacteriota bacterium]